MDDDRIAQVMAITSAEHGTAKHLLESCAGDVNRAVEMFFESGAGDSGHDENAAAIAVAAAEDDGVRAPIAAVQDQLVDRPGGHMLAMMGITPGGVYQTPSSANIFKSKSSKNGASSKKGAHLEKLFAPPEHLMFHGPFALAKEQGKQSNKWVLVNLQDDGNFDCHILNRDVWKNEGVAAVVEHHFLLWQQTHSYGDGQAAMHMYHLDKGMLPAVLAIDPITGAEMKRLTGLIKPQDMLQWLLDFVRTHPAPDAARARADEDARLTALKRPRGESASRVAASVAAHTKQARGGSSGAAVKSAYAYTAGDDSDEYEYISDSDGDGGSGGGAGVSQASEQASPARQGRAEHPDSPAPPAPAASGDQGSSAAVPDIGNTKGGATPSQGGVGLPTPLTVTCISPEPAAGEGITRLQLRLPQGKRLVRRFASSEPVSILYAVAGALLSRPHILAGCYALHRVARSEAAANEVGLPDSITPQSATAALMEAAVSDDLVQGVQGGAAFDINTPYPTTSLREQGFKTLAEAKLLNSTVVVELS